MDKNKKLVVVILSVIAIFAIVILIMSRSPETPLPPSESVLVSHSERTVSEPERKLERVVSAETAAPVSEKNRVSRELQPDEDPVDDVPLIDPEDQPRAHFGIDFTSVAALPGGYKLENVQLTEKGVQLIPPEPGEENAPRFGVLESAPEEMAFPSNALSPYWKEDLPEDSSIFVEVCVSPDGKTWSLWNTVMPDTDSDSLDEPVSQFLPDGSPNPYYGHTPGGVFFWGMRQYYYFKYRVNFYAETADSPTLSSFRVFYQDSTLGQGHIAEINPDEMDRYQTFPESDSMD